jgi:hypothetical protein
MLGRKYQECGEAITCNEITGLFKKHYQLKLKGRKMR